MKLSDTIAAQLKKLDYEINSFEELFPALPNVISTKIGKSIKRTPIIFLIKIDSKGYTVSVVIESGENDPEILHKILGKNLIDVFGSMIIWLEKSGLLDGDSD